MNIYVASSWRNPHQQAIVALLREDGHRVYDFRNPAPDSAGFSWRQIGDRFGKCRACGEEDPLNKPKPCPKKLQNPDGSVNANAVYGVMTVTDSRGGFRTQPTYETATYVHDWVGGWDAAYYATEVLDHPVAAQGFAFDMDALDAADACVLVQPCGRSAHLELGYAAGKGKLTVVYYPALDEPELMVRMCDYVVTTTEELRHVLSTNRPPPRWQRDVAAYDARFPGTAASSRDTYARPGERVGPCRPYCHRECPTCKGCWRHGACTCPGPTYAGPFTL